MQQQKELQSAHGNPDFQHDEPSTAPTRAPDPQTSVLAKATGSKNNSDRPPVLTKAAKKDCTPQEDFADPPSIESLPPKSPPCSPLATYKGKGKGKGKTSKNTGK